MRAIGWRRREDGCKKRSGDLTPGEVTTVTTIMRGEPADGDLVQGDAGEADGAITVAEKDTGRTLRIKASQI